MTNPTHKQATYTLFMQDKKDRFISTITLVDAATAK